MTRFKRISEIFPDWMISGGIFSALNELDVPWKDENIKTSLDLEYFGNISGSKILSPLVDKLLIGETLSDTDIATLARVIYSINHVNWDKLWETLEFEYDPIENYSMTETMTDDQTVIEYGKTHTRTDDLEHTRTGTETETPDITDQRTDNTTHTKTGTETDTPDLTEETTPDKTITQDNSIYGFNSVSASPTGSQEQTETGTETVTKTGTDEHEYDLEEKDTGTVTNKRTGTDEREYDLTDADTGTVVDEDEGSDTHTRNYVLTRQGNIGVTTSQQMIESERNLWIWNYFYNVVFPDVDRVLTINLY